MEQIVDIYQFDYKLQMETRSCWGQSSLMKKLEG